MKKLLSVVMTVFAAACSNEGSTGVVSDPEASHQSSEALVQTQGTEFDLVSRNGMLEGSVPYTYRNTLPDTLYIVNCLGQVAASFQKKSGDTWQNFWSPTVLLCLSPPVKIAPGTSITGTARIYGSRAGANSYPQLPNGDLTGTYRLLISPVVFHYTDRGQRFGAPVPLEQRVSNEFRLRGGFR